MGGRHVIDTEAIGEPSSRSVIGRPDESENHDPTARDPDGSTRKNPTPLLEIEIDIEVVEVTVPYEMVDPGAGVDEYTGAAEHVSV